MQRHPNMREVLLDRSAHVPLVPAERLGLRPVVAISREPGARAGELARALGRQLGLQVFDRELIRWIAQSAQFDERAVAALDERDRPLLTDWLECFAPEAHLSPYGYFQHLTRVVESIAHLGGAVILGRGAHLILSPRQALRVRVVAPLAVRVRVVAEREGVDPREAQRRIESEERERRAFLTRYFHAEADDASAFDLVVNTAALGLEGAVDAIRGGLGRLARSAIA